jgi:preprotein translocase subunit SecY
MITWWGAVVLGLLSILGKFVPTLPLISHYYWFMGAGWLVFAVSTVIDTL